VNFRKTETILDEIVAQKIVRLALQRERTPLAQIIEQAQLAFETRDFASAIRRKQKISLIAEIKKTSPSRGLLREALEPAELARAYERAGASAISVVTEEGFFLGSPDYLTAARNVAKLPVLRKDFIFDPYQVHQSRALGADAVLLIAAILDSPRLADLITLVESYAMTALVEVHNGEELKRALDCGVTVIGINNRNLKTMRVDTSTTARLLKLVPRGTTVVAESGIHSYEDMRMFDLLGVDAALVGEAIVTADDAEGKIRSLLGESID
jgi:indole-3-glycerol phosphate synthase